MRSNILLMIIMITPLSGFCQSEYYYDYDKYTRVEYSDNYIAIETNDNLTDWPSFFENNELIIIN